jgi:uncharacterized protein
MLEARKLLEWHLAREQWKVASSAIEQLKREEQELQARRRECQGKVEQLGVPAEDDIDARIAYALAQQELLLAEKGIERFMEERFAKEMDLRQSRQEWEDKAKKLEESLAPHTFLLYEQVAENVANPVVEVKRRSCMGCFLPLSVAKMEEWRKGKNFVQCEECGRILV